MNVAHKAFFVRFVLFAANFSFSSCYVLTICVNMRKRRSKRRCFAFSGTWEMKDTLVSWWNRKEYQKDYKIKSGTSQVHKNYIIFRFVAVYSHFSVYMRCGSIRIQLYLGDEYELVINRITYWKAVHVEDKVWTRKEKNYQWNELRDRMMASSSQTRS